MISMFKWLLGCGVGAAIFGLSSLAQATPPSSSTDTQSASSDVPPEAQAEELPYEEGQPIRSGYKVEERTRTGWVVSGSILFGLSWGGSILAGIGRGATSETGDHAGNALFVPVIGPFAFARNASEGSNVSFYVVDGILQTAGVAMLLYGILAPKKVLVRQEIATIAHPEILVGPGSIGMKFSF